MIVEDGKIKFQSDYERDIVANDYYLYTQNERGKKWLEEKKLALLDPDGFKRATYNEYQAGYGNGRDDFIREILLNIDTYKIWLGQGKEDNE